MRKENQVRVRPDLPQSCGRTVRRVVSRESRPSVFVTAMASADLAKYLCTFAWYGAGDFGMLSGAPSATADSALRMSTTSSHRKPATSQRKQQVELGRASICVALHVHCWISHRCTHEACAEHLAVAVLRGRTMYGTFTKDHC